MIIAQRTLKIVAGPSAGAAVVISVYLPEQVEESWACIYEIDWPGRPRRSAAAGLDAMQALIAAMQKIGVELYASVYHQSDTLAFDGQGKGYGFPVPKPMRDMLIGDDAKFDGN